MKYKTSYYNFIKDDTDGSKIIYNTKTGAIDIVEPNNINHFNEILNNSGSEIDNNDELSTIMLQQGYLVEYSHDEKQDIIDWNRKASTVDNIAYLTILPTETCNFACPYCFIYSFREKHMTTETWEGLYSYCQKFFEKNKNMDWSHLDITWFGGEPLIVSDKIINFMQRLQKLLGTYPNARINSNIVTNGYLLTYNLFQKLIDVGIRRFQVTLDGDAENHDKLRTLADKKPTFDIIYKNLLEIHSKVDKDVKFDFAIRGNFLKSSIQSCERLLKMFRHDFGDDGRWHIYFRPVYNFETDRDTISEIQDTEILGCEEGVRIQNRLSMDSYNLDPNELENITNPLPQPRHSWCTSINRNAHIIGFDGAAFSCDTMITDRKDAVGELTKDGIIKLNDNADTWKKSIFDNHENLGTMLDECLVCKLLPVCVGGCNRSRLINGTNPCFWTEQLILDAMDEYVAAYK